MTQHPDAPAIGFIGRIPVRNIWLLLLYASQLYKELPEAARVELEDAPDDIPELVAEILANAVERRLRRNLSFGYERREADLSRVRGRINVLRTERRQLLQRGRVACVFDELTVDTPRNRYVKAALLKLGQVVQKTDLSRRCRNLAAQLERAGVSSDWDAGWNGRHPPPDALGWMEAAERRMLAAARLAFELFLPTEDAGASALPAPYREERWVRRLFEAAVGGFYDVVLSPSGWGVKAGDKIAWPLEGPTPGLRELMPGMITDIRLQRGQRRIVIDTKFTSIVTTGQWGNQSLKSGHIYQIYAYLRSQERSDDPLSITSTGVLLYPAIDACIDEAATIQGHEMRFVTVDLAADTPKVRRQLLRVIDPRPALNGERGPSE